MVPATEKVVQHTREEILAVIEEKAQARRDMSAIDLLRAYEEGTLDNPSEVYDLILLAKLLPSEK